MLATFLTGITEPLEFTFLFLAYPLYLIHCVFAGLGFWLSDVMGNNLGMGGNFIELIIYGIVPAAAGTQLGM